MHNISQNTIDLSKDIILENDRVKLSPLKLEDFNELLPFSLTEPELWDYSLISGSGKKQLQSYINSALKNRATGIALPFVVFDREKNKVAGTTRFYNFDKANNVISIGHTWYGKEFQGTGLNKNCKLLLLSQAFDNWNIERVEFRADLQNKRSINAMKSIGCIEEGILRSNCKSQDGRRDSIILSILKDEWNSSVKKNLMSRV